MKQNGDLPGPLSSLLHTSAVLDAHLLVGSGLHLAVWSPWAGVSSDRSCSLDSVLHQHLLLFLALLAKASQHGMVATLHTRKTQLEEITSDSKSLPSAAKGRLPFDPLLTLPSHQPTGWATVSFFKSGAHGSNSHLLIQVCREG